MISDKKLTSFTNALLWLEDIIGLEIEYFYSPWYGEKPFLDTVHPELIEFAAEYYPGYYKRIKSLDKTIFFTKRRMRSSEI